jgi:bifunctional DNase/RNase
MKVNFGKFRKKLGLDSLRRNSQPTGKKINPSKMKIDDTLDEDYEVVKINNIGLTAPFGIEGAIVLKAEGGQEFPISAFSGEVARHISNFIDEKRDTLPSIYNLVEQVCEESELLLVKVKLYENGGTLRANLYFTGRKDIVLRNFRASDAIALATFYGIPILIRKTLLEQQPQTS